MWRPMHRKWKICQVEVNVRELSFGPWSKISPTRPYPCLNENEQDSRGPCLNESEGMYDGVRSILRY